jgi:PAS domain S-box-containing protein
MGMTELEQLRAELAQTKALLWQREQLLANTEQGIWHLDNAGLTVFVNPAMCRLLGRERDDVMGHRVFDFFSGPDLAILNEQLERRKQGHKKGYEIGLVRPDGTRVECFNNATPIFDATGAKQGSVGMWTDLTPLKQTQRELDAALADSQAQRAEYEALLASFPGLIAVVDQDGRYVYVNQAQADLFGLPAAEVIGRTMLEMRGPERAALLFAEYPRLRAGEVIRDIVEHPARGDRPAVTVRVNRVAAPPREHGQHYYAFSIDITDILKGEARSNFLARMSHEIRTPMHAIIGLTAVTLGTELTPEQQDYLGQVHMAGQALMGLLDEVLDLSKIDAGKVHMEVIPFDLKSILDGTAAVLAQLVKDKGLNLRLSCPPEVPRQLLGDPTRLRQVLTNLISKLDDTHYVVEVAVAGFRENELSVELKEGVLTVTGEQVKPENEPQYLHKGISARNFTRTFTLAENMEVRGATVTNGILAIALEHIIPEEKQPKKIAITFNK